LAGDTLLPRLSAIIIVLNEADNIAACLDALSFCDERIVVDGGSADTTVHIAQGKGARVVSHPFEGFGAQKGLALSLATGEWVLSIDADERVSPALAEEIRNTIGGGGADCYELSRRSTFCDRIMNHSAWSPDYVLRLFRRDMAYFSSDLVHERVICNGTVSRLSQPLMHHPVRRLEDALSRMDRYSTAGAEQLTAAGKNVSFMSGISHGLWSFFRTYVLRAGFLDGREGFLLAVANAEGTYYRYMKAWLKGRKR
jgi:glycosyltransferase involved in cell wall biosynthesis